MRNRLKTTLKESEGDKGRDEGRTEGLVQLGISVVANIRREEHFLVRVPSISLQCRRILVGRVDIYFYRLFRPLS